VRFNQPLFSQEISYCFNSTGMSLIVNTTLFASLVALIGAQPANWPLLEKLPQHAEKGALRGSMASDWTPASSVDGQHLADPTLGRNFLSEIEAAMGFELLNGKQGYYADIAKTLRPTFESLDKNEYGNLGHTAVRYALHRLFVARHGWMIKGLDPAGRHFNSSSPVQVFTGKVPPRVQGLFESRLGAKGFGLEELAVFGALLEELISQETGSRLSAVYKILDWPVDKKIDYEVMELIVEAYMTAFILGFDISSWDLATLMRYRKAMPDSYASWADAKKFMGELRAEVLGEKTSFAFVDVEELLVTFGERFGQWQNFECVSQKKRLMELEDGEKGCVPISSFYKPMLSSKGKDWHFSESTDYLKALGIVDSRDPKNMQVMVPNYLNAPSNCIATSKYYFVCCIDECESLLGHIERFVAGPTAQPSKLAAFVSRLASSTESANRTLTAIQLRRLWSIAEKHGGEVPIHGRLFMQWMHSVYPRECAYPHLSGTVQSLSTDEWLNATGIMPVASWKELKSTVEMGSKADSHDDNGQCGRWQEEEELFVGYSRRLQMHELETDVHTWVATGSVALLCAVASMTLGLIATFRSMKAASLKQGLMVI